MSRGTLGSAIRFLIVGGIGTLIDAVLFAGLVAYGLPPAPSNVCSYSLSAVASFFLHRGWTFAAREDQIAGQAVRFAAMVAGGLLLSTAIVFALAGLIGPLPAKLAAIAATLVFNFTLSRLVVFSSPGRLASRRGL
jgi:putative flippase GtrA